jgi:hypothetical protein
MAFDLAILTGLIIKWHGYQRKISGFCQSRFGKGIKI